jgi:hypothetical protein
MPKRDDDKTTGAGMRGAAGSTADSMEQRMLAFAEQLGRMVGTVQAKAEGWLDRDALNAQISSVRDSAADLLDQLGGGSRAQGSTRNANAKANVNRQPSPGRGAAKNARPKTASTATSKVSAKGKVPTKARAAATSGAAATKSAGRARSGGAVDAPGKKHRKPMPSESGATGSPRGEGSRIAKLKAANMNRLQRRG